MYKLDEDSENFGESTSEPTTDSADSPVVDRELGTRESDSAPQNDSSSHLSKSPPSPTTNGLTADTFQPEPSASGDSSKTNAVQAPPPVPQITTAAKKSYGSFLEKLRHPSMSEVVEKTKQFVQGYTQKPKKEAAEIIHRFVSSTQTELCEAPAYKDATAEDLEAASEGFEKFLLIKLHAKLFLADPKDLAEDQSLHRHIFCIQQFLTLQHLDIDLPFSAINALELAVDELKKINSYKAPRDKLVCIMNACRVVGNILHSSHMRSGSKAEGTVSEPSMSMPAESEDLAFAAQSAQANGEFLASPPGADDFLPLLIWVVVQANLPRLHSNLEFISCFRHPDRLTGEDMYWFTQLVAAVSFVSKISGLDSLSIEQEEYDRLYAKAAHIYDTEVQRNAAHVASTILAPITPPKAPASPSHAEQIHHNINREPTPNPQATEEIKKFLNTKMFNQTWTFAQPTLAVDDINVGQLPLLLQEYKSLHALLQEATQLLASTNQISIKPVDGDKSGVKAAANAENLSLASVADPFRWFLGNKPTNAAKVHVPIVQQKLTPT
eukprot:Platyproteum_vivax@DN10900_c0_g1_i1.p1